jgi:hypothetical protein
MATLIIYLSGLIILDYKKYDCFGEIHILISSKYKITDYLYYPVGCIVNSRIIKSWHWKDSFEYENVVTGVEMEGKLVK